MRRILIAAGIPRCRQSDGGPAAHRDADVLCEGHYGIYKGQLDIVRFVSSFMR